MLDHHRLMIFHPPEMLSFVNPTGYVGEGHDEGNKFIRLQITKRGQRN